MANPTNRDTDGNWLKNTPNTVPIEGIVSQQDGYIGLQEWPKKFIKMNLIR